MGCVGSELRMTDEFHHVPVLLSETIEYIAPRPGGTYVDCTLGGAGHSLEILQKMQLTGRLIAIDQDESAVAVARQRMKVFGETVTIVHGSFGDLGAIVKAQGVSGVDGVLYDLGVSSPQLDEADRGFSYMADAPLDMRMDRRSATTAADLVNGLPVDQLARVIMEYGEDRWAARIAQFVVAARSRERIATTGQLVDAIKAAIPAAARRTGPHPAKRTFQALRIAVNDELGVFARSLEDAIGLLNPGGRICVISFHSLEDRIAKEMFSKHARECVCPPGLPVCMCQHVRTLKVLTRKPVTPSETELTYNPRARSSKLRVAERI